GCQSDNTSTKRRPPCGPSPPRQAGLHKPSHILRTSRLRPLERVATLAEVLRGDLLRPAVGDAHRAGLTARIDEAPFERALLDLVDAEGHSLAPSTTAGAIEKGHVEDFRFFRRVDGVCSLEEDIDATA